jgi:hypothetical protein
LVLDIEELYNVSNLPEENVSVLVEFVRTGQLSRGVLELPTLSRKTGTLDTPSKI